MASETNKIHNEETELGLGRGSLGRGGRPVVGVVV